VAVKKGLDGAGTLNGAWRRVRPPMRLILAQLDLASRDLFNGGEGVVIGVRSGRTEGDGAGTLSGVWRRVQRRMGLILARLGRASRDLSNSCRGVMIRVL
jgi:hypothetical protein